MPGQRQNINGIHTAPPANVTVFLNEAESSSKHKNDIWNLVAREARAVSAWAFLAPLLRLAFAPLIACVSGDTCSSRLFSVLAGWVLWLLPKSVAQNMAPGFIFASAWLLFAVRDSFGVVPNVPIRICEMIMGRLSPKDLCIVLPIHFLCTLSTFMILNLLLPVSMASIALAPISYSHDNPWFMDCVYEMAINAAFCVTFLVVPEIFALNNVPRLLTAVILYPLYSFGVDSRGMGSTFGPNVLYALASVAGGGQENSQQTTFRLVGVMLGGVLGGFIMRGYFPDDTKR